MTDDLRSPLTRPCHICGKPVDPNSRFTYRRIVGWGRPGQAGGSDIVKRQPYGEVFAHPGCVDGPSQPSLLP